MYARLIDIVYHTIIMIKNEFLSILNTTFYLFEFFYYTDTFLYCLFYSVLQFIWRLKHFTWVYRFAGSSYICLRWAFQNFIKLFFEWSWSCHLWWWNWLELFRLRYWNCFLFLSCSICLFSLEWSLLLRFVNIRLII